MSEREIIIGNLTTIIMFVFSTIGGGAIVNWLGGTSQAGILIGAILGLLYSIINAYFPNHMKWLKNNKDNISSVANTIPESETCECSEEECTCSEEDEGGC